MRFTFKTPFGPRQDFESRFPAWLGYSLALIIGLFILWGAYWFTLASIAKDRLTTALADQIGKSTRISSPFELSIDGFPGPLTLIWPQVHVESPEAVVDIGALELRVWPFPGAPVAVYGASGVKVNLINEGRSFDFDAASLNLRLPKIWQPKGQWSVVIKDASVTRGNSVMEATGDVIVPLNDLEYPVTGSMNAALSGYGDLVNYLQEQTLIDEQAAGMAKSFMTMLATAQGTPGTLRTPITVNNNWLYVGPIRTVNVRPSAPAVNPALAPASGFEMLPPQTRPDDSGSASSPTPIP